MAMVAQVARGLKYTMRARPRLAALGQKKHSPTVLKLKTVYPTTSFGDALGKAVYFISDVLRDAHEQYPMMQKLLLAILIASSKLRHYFEAHPITVVSQYNLRHPLQDREATGCIAEWALEILGFGLQFDCVTAIKSQALADFTT